MKRWQKIWAGPPAPSFGQNPKVQQFFSREIVSYIIMDYFLIRSWSLSSFAKVLSLGWCGHGGISFRESWKEFNLAFLRVIILGTRAPHPPPSVKMNRIKCLPDIFPFYFFTMRCSRNPPGQRSYHNLKTCRNLVLFTAIQVSLLYQLIPSFIVPCTT